MMKHTYPASITLLAAALVVVLVSLLASLAAAEKPIQTWKKHLLSANKPGASNILPLDLDADGHVDYLASRGHGKGVL